MPPDIYLGTHQKSQKREITLLTLQDYFHAKDDDEVQQLLQATATSQSLNLYHDTKAHVTFKPFLDANVSTLLVL